MAFMDSYNMRWLLVDVETGEEREEKYENISLDDFETIYGNNIHVIKECSLLLIDNGTFPTYDEIKETNKFKAT